MTQLGIKSDGTPYKRRLSKRTRRLNLYHQDLVSIDLSALAAAPNLEILELGRNPLQTLDLVPLVHCPNLAELVLIAQTPVDLTPLAACGNLRALHIYAQAWPTLDLSPLAGLAHLESVLVHGDAFSGLDLSPLGDCPALRSLSLHCPMLRHTSLAPLATCTAFASLTIQHTPLTSLTFFPWPNFQRFNLLAVPLQAVDLIPLYDSPLERVWFVEHKLDQVDLTPLVGIETLDDLYFKPMLRLTLDDVYAHHPQRILSPGVREHVEAGVCVATGWMTRLQVLALQLAQQPPRAVDRYAGMDEPTFWRLIEDARHDASAEERDMASEIMRRLWTLPPEDLHWRLMGVPGEDVHQAVYEVQGGCSDDDFLDFREGLIAQGRETFYQVVNDPRVLYEWEDWIAVTEGVISTPLARVRQARGAKG